MIVSSVVLSSAAIKTQAPSSGESCVADYLRSLLGWELISEEKLSVHEVGYPKESVMPSLDMRSSIMISFINSDVLFYQAVQGPTITD